ncbi:unnamed protein product [Amoebophrya sp. A120]|nr:unnamed protein product [Amoebophrya sp. A120]|eukprot:GSA120T00013043001.1
MSGVKMPSALGHDDARATYLPRKPTAVTKVSFTRKNLGQSVNRDALHILEVKQQEGRIAFASKDYALAVRCWEEGVRAAVEVDIKSREQFEKREQLLSVLKVNLLAALLRAGSFDRCFVPAVLKGKPVPARADEVLMLTASKVESAWLTSDQLEKKWIRLFEAHCGLAHWNVCKYVLRRLGACRTKEEIEELFTKDEPWQKALESGEAVVKGEITEQLETTSLSTDAAKTTSTTATYATYAKTYRCYHQVGSRLRDLRARLKDKDAEGLRTNIEALLAEWKDDGKLWCIFVAKGGIRLVVDLQEKFVPLDTDWGGSTTADGENRNHLQASFDRIKELIRTHAAPAAKFENTETAVRTAKNGISTAVSFDSINLQE